MFVGPVDCGGSGPVPGGGGLRLGPFAVEVREVDVGLDAAVGQQRQLALVLRRLRPLRRLGALGRRRLGGDRVFRLPVHHRHDAAAAGKGKPQKLTSLSVYWLTQVE